MDWKRCAWGWVSGRWLIREVRWAGARMFWVYRDGHRVNTTGHYDDSVHFATLKEAKKFVTEEVS